MCEVLGRQRLRVGRVHARKIVTIVVHDNHFQVLDNDQELSSHVRTTTRPVTRFGTWRRSPTS